MLLPNSCTIKEQGKKCLNLPEFVISVIAENGEYMVGVTCQKHKILVTEKLKNLQTEGKIPKGKINFSGLKAVGTDCIKGNPDDLIQL